MEGNGVDFNKKVRATAFAGEVLTEIKGLREKQDEMYALTLSMKSHQDKWLGAIALVAGGISVVSAIISIYALLFA